MTYHEKIVRYKFVLIKSSGLTIDCAFETSERLVIVKIKLGIFAQNSQKSVNLSFSLSIVNCGRDRYNYYFLNLHLIKSIIHHFLLSLLIRSLLPSIEWWSLMNSLLLLLLLLPSALPECIKWTECNKAVRNCLDLSLIFPLNDL